MENNRLAGIDKYSVFKYEEVTFEVPSQYGNHLSKPDATFERERRMGVFVVKTDLWDSYKNFNYLYTKMLVDNLGTFIQPTVWVESRLPLSRYTQLSSYINEMAKAENIPMQIQYTTPVVLLINELFDEQPKDGNVFSKKLLMLLKATLKKNCGEVMFSEQHISIFLEMVNTCNEGNVTIDDIDKYDKDLFFLNLNNLPVWE